MRKYVIVTNDRGTVVEASAYQFSSRGMFIGRNAHHRVNIGYTPKRRDKLRYHEKVITREEFEKISEYFKQLDQIESAGEHFRG